MAENSTYRSLTILAKDVNKIVNKDISRDSYLTFLVEKGYVDDIRTINSEGFNHDIKYAYSNDGRSKWPTYGLEIVNLLAANIDLISSIDSQHKSTRSGTKTEKRESHSAHKSAPSPAPILENFFDFDSDYAFKYLKLDEFVTIDTETTGLSKNDEVVELAIVGMDKQVLYYSTFYPTVEVNPAAAKVNHFSKAKLKGSPCIKDEWQKIVEAIGNKKVLCHNTPFDKRLLTQTFARYNIPYDIERAFNGAYDSKDIAKKWIKSDKYDLNHLAHLVGIEREELHEATDDCVMTIEVLERLEYALKMKHEVLK